ncbi:MAG: redoxin domain-containing protein [Longimicrobiales bacterium]
MKVPSVGSAAPDFELQRKIGEPAFRLSAQQGVRAVVVLFFPLAFSGVCTAEMCQIAEDYGSWSDLDAEVVGISVDSPFVNQKFAESIGATFPMLSDFNKTASTAYGVLNDDFFGMKGVSNRSAFVVDREGIVRYAWTSEDASIMPDFDQVKAALSVIQG